MKVSSFGNKFDKLEQLIHHHVEPSSTNRYRFQTIDGKTLKNTKILKDFEALAKVMEKKHESLDLDEKKAIYRVLKTIKDIASDKINHRYIIFSEQSHPVLLKRIMQITSLLERLGVKHQKTLSQDEHHHVNSQSSHLQSIESRGVPRIAQ